MHSVVIAKEQVPSFAPSLRQDFSQVAFRVGVALGGPPAPAMKSGVRKKRASETYWKIDVLLLTNDDL